MKKNVHILILLSFIALEFWMWSEIYAIRSFESGFYFLNVGQGDAALISLEGGVQILTDGGPDRSASRELEKILPLGDTYIDIGIITHAENDHFGGFLPLLETYKFGAILWNGRDPDKKNPSWDALKEAITEKKTPLITVGAGDRIRIGAEEILILSPNGALLGSSNLNDGCIVTMNKALGLRALFPCDGGFMTEEHLLRSVPLSADILKAGHHGSKFSSNALFLKAVDPRLVVIGAGEGNSYGHPAEETLARLRDFTSSAVFRTDKDGTIFVSRRNGELTVRTEE